MKDPITACHCCSEVTFTITAKSIAYLIVSILTHQVLWARPHRFLGVSKQFQLWHTLKGVHNKLIYTLQVLVGYNRE